jgi:hypothetical protein
MKVKLSKSIGWTSANKHFFHCSFIEDKLAYEDEPDSQDGTYIPGIFYIKNKFWKYGLYNDTASQINVEGVYSRVFKDISEIKNNKLP